MYLRGNVAPMAAVPTLTIVLHRLARIVMTPDATTKKFRRSMIPADIVCAVSHYFVPRKASRAGAGEDQRRKGLSLDDPVLLASAIRIWLPTHLAVGYFGHRPLYPVF